MSSADEQEQSHSESTDDKPESKSSDNLREQIEQIDDLPALPVAVQRINRIIEEPGTNADDVGEVLETDPSLTAQVLKMVNSAYFGLRRRITSLSEAVVYLGFETIRNLVLNASVIRLTTSSNHGQFTEYEFNWPGFWKKSVATGIATQTVARELRITGHEAAMPAGTLHMLGVLVLRSKLPQQFKQILELTRKQEHSYLEAEIEVLGTNSTQIGLWLSEDWDLPRDMLMGLSNWIDPLEVPEDDQLVPILVHTGERLARARGVGWNPEGEVSLSKAILSELNITPSTFEDILDQYRRDLKDATYFMKICEQID